MSASPDAGNVLAAATRCVALGRPEPVGGAPVNPAIVLSSTYRHGGDAAYDRDVTYDRDRAYDDGPLLDSDRDGRGPIEEVLDGPDDPANPRRS